MMRVRTRIGPSDIQGLGLFALQPITKGQTVWELDEDLDRVLTYAEYRRHPPLVRRWMNRFVYQSRTSRVIIFYSDDARFINHQPVAVATVRSIPDRLKVAIRDIAVGEELTEDYDIIERPHWHPYTRAAEGR
jgi:hypothetical protein